MTPELALIAFLIGLPALLLVFCIAECRDACWREAAEREIDK
jgi:hypothetical protein